jgi:hypothetical protein
MALPKDASDTNAPCDEAIAVDVSAADQSLAPFARALYIGVTGDVTVDMAKTGTAILFKAVPAGTYLRIIVGKVYKTGTSATSIIALW